MRGTGKAAVTAGVVGLLAFGIVLTDRSGTEAGASEARAAAADPDATTGHDRPGAIADEAIDAPDEPGIAGTADPAPAVEDPSVVAVSAVVRTEVEAEVPSNPASKRWCADDPRLDTRLGRMKFRLAEHVRDADAVLRNEFLNPEGRRLSAAAKAELNALLRERIARATVLERAYAATRSAHLRRRIETDRFERLPTDEPSRRGAQKKRSDDEEIVIAMDAAKGEVLVRIAWDDDPSITRGRDELLGFKTDSMATIAAFVSQHGERP